MSQITNKKQDSFLPGFKKGSLLKKEEKLNLFNLGHNMHETLANYLLPSDLKKFSMTNKNYLIICKKNSLYEKFLRPEILDNKKLYQGNPGQAEELYKNPIFRKDEYTSKTEIKMFLKKNYPYMNSYASYKIYKYGLSALREGLFTIDQIPHMNSDTFDKFLDKGTSALREKLFTIDQISHMDSNEIDDYLKNILTG